MPINYEALRSGDTNAQLPADGAHVARLERAAIVQTSKGERLVTEWAEATGPAGWTSWNRFDESGLNFTVELLDGLGIDRANLTNDDVFATELENAVGNYYEVRTETKAGSQGDRYFTSTYVNGISQGVQEAMTVDVPADTQGLQPTLAAAVQDDDDIPF